MTQLTIKSLLARAVQDLAQNKIIHNHHLEAEMLLCFVLKKERVYLFAHHDNIVTPKDARQFADLIKKRLNNWPIAYLTNEKYFYNYRFFIDKNVLIPRPETEVLIDCLLAEFKKNKSPKNIFIDVGTGSGCIAITTKKEIDKKIGKQINNIFYAADISTAALNVARKNAKNLEAADINFKKSDLLGAFLKNKKFHTEVDNANIFITANLPYLTNKQIKSSPSIQKEPYLALYAKNSGLFFYVELLKQIKTIKQAKKTKNIFSFFEIDEIQSEKIEKLIRKIIPSARIEIAKDLYGADRVVIMRM